MSEQRIKLTKRIYNLDTEISELQYYSKQPKLDVAICGNKFQGDTAKLLIACTLNALISQRENYIEQLESELKNIRTVV